MIAIIIAYFAILAGIITAEGMRELQAGKATYRKIQESLSKHNVPAHKGIAEVVCEIFTRFFSVNTPSKRVSFIKSAIISAIAVIASFAIFFLSGYEIPVAAQFSSLDISAAFLILFFGNIIADYISLEQTRTFLEISRKVDHIRELIILVATDIFMTLLISLFVLSFFMTLSLYAFSSLTPRAEEVIIEKGTPVETKENSDGQLTVDPFDFIWINSINLRIENSRRLDYALERMKHLVNDELDGILESVIRERGGVVAQGKYYYPVAEKLPRDLDERNTVKIPGIFNTNETDACELFVNDMLNSERPKGLIDFVQFSKEEIKDRCLKVMHGTSWRLDYELGVAPMYPFSITWSKQFDLLFDAYRGMYSSLLRYDYPLRVRDFLVGGDNDFIEYVASQNITDDDMRTEHSGVYRKRMLDTQGKDLGRLYDKTLDGRYGNIVQTDNIYIRPFLFTTIIPTIIIWSIMIGSIIFRNYSFRIMYVIEKFKFKKEFPISNLLIIGSFPLLVLYILISFLS